MIGALQLYPLMWVSGCKHTSVMSVCVQLLKPTLPPRSPPVTLRLNHPFIHYFGFKIFLSSESCFNLLISIWKKFIGNVTFWQFEDFLPKMWGYSTPYALEQWWSTIPPISTKQTTISHFKPTANKNETNDVGNPGPGLGQAQKCGRVKTVNGIPTLLLLIIECGSKTTN